MSEAEKLSDEVDSALLDALPEDTEQVEPEESAPSPETEQVKTEPEEQRTEEAKAEPEKVETDDGELSKGEKKYLARQKYKAEQAKREAEELRKKLEEAEQKLAESNAKPEPEIPEAPDPFDDDFQERQKAREAALLERAKWEQEKRQAETERQRLAQERQQREIAEQQRIAQERESEYIKRIEKSGVTPEEVTASLSKISQEHQQLPEALRQALLHDPDSPLIAKYLADNSDDIWLMHGMNDYQATQFLLSEIKPQALQLKPKTSTAPEPPEQLDGGGKTEIDILDQLGASTF